MSDEYAAVEIVQDDSGWTWEVQVGDRRWNGLSESFERAVEECQRRLPAASRTIVVSDVLGADSGLFGRPHVPAAGLPETRNE